ncbi:sensor histidine kinase [Acidimangrovimonas sediminis]|uniref:sensor histidine kinase n=1 Tax=Acidimangrovimonas sediminis TaxID=2056283 RepID=UPI000C80A3C3|nr:histidine kinase N-terminal 7TM domain-containing protein [Acidimangrovimonas sediminis]
MECLRLSSSDPALLFGSFVWLGLLLLTLWVWQRPRLPAHGCFLVAHAAMLWWLLGALLELSSHGAACKAFWAEATFPATVLMPTGWALFLFGYALGYEQEGKPLRRLALVGGPAVAAVVALSNPLHHLFYGPATRMAEVDGRQAMIYDHGPLFYVMICYSYLYLVAAFSVMIMSIVRAERDYRGFLVTLLFVTSVPVAANLAYNVWGTTLFGLDPTAFMFVFVLVAFGMLAVNNRMMDVNMLTRDILFYRSSDPIVVINDRGRLEGASPEARYVFGADLPPPGGPVAGVPHIGPIAERLFAPGDRRTEPVMEIAGRSFSPRVVALVSPMLPRRPPLGWAIQLVDVTAQQEVAAALRRAAESAEAASLAKSQFLSTVSHELRTPLTSIKGSLDLMASGALGPLPERAHQAMGIAARNSSRLVGLINDLLDLQRIELGEMAIAHEPVDLSAIVADAVEAAEGYGRALEVNLVAEVDRGPVVVRGDTARLMQVMANLLSNALKFSEAGGKVTVRLERGRDTARIEVQDHGSGIPEDFRDKVFEPFRQADASNTRKIGGSGLGLSITRRILDHLNGRISFESAPGVGTTFFIDLPLLELSSSHAA